MTEVVVRVSKTPIHPTPQPMEQPVKLITVEGSIGIGKSTLLLRLKDRLAHDPSVVFVEERVSDWVHHGFLQRVYSEPAVRLAFQQMALTCLICDLRRALSSTPAPRLIIMERSPFGNYHVFAKANLDGRGPEDVQVYSRPAYDYPA